MASVSSSLVSGYSTISLLQSPGFRDVTQSQFESRYKSFEKVQGNLDFLTPKMKVPISFDQQTRRWNPDRPESSTTPLLKLQNLTSHPYFRACAVWGAQAATSYGSS